MNALIDELIVGVQDLQITAMNAGEALSWSLSSVLFQWLNIPLESGRYRIIGVRDIDHLGPRNKTRLAVCSLTYIFLKTLLNMILVSTSWTCIDILYVFIRYYSLAYILINTYGAYIS